MATFLLVHGAWHGAWCWAKLIPALEARGHKAVAIDLPGHGADRTPLKDVTLEAYARAVAEAAAALPERPIVVGHSMGGPVIAAGAERAPDAMKRLVFLCAFLPKNGDMVLALTSNDPKSLVPGVLVPAADGVTTGANPALLRDVFYADCGDDDIERARKMLTPQPLAPLTVPMVLTANRFGGVPRDYIICEDDRAISAGYQRAMLKAVPCERVVELQTSHSPFFSAPEKLADVLGGFAA
jgi:pimeloyl-ACP methyl ester carboxylesterase